MQQQKEKEDLGEEMRREWGANEAAKGGMRGFETAIGLRPEWALGRRGGARDSTRAALWRDGKARLPQENVGFKSIQIKERGRKGERKGGSWCGAWAPRMGRSSHRVRGESGGPREICSVEE